MQCFALRLSLFLRRVPCLPQWPTGDLGRLEVHCQFERREVDGAFELIAAHFT